MLIVLVVALLPAAVAAGILALAIYRTWAIVPIIAPALVVLVVLLVEALVATEWLGGVFERTDVGVLTSET